MALGDLRENECQNSYRSLRRARDERTSPSYRSVRESEQPQRSLRRSLCDRQEGPSGASEKR